MTRYEKPSWGKVILVGIAFILVIMAVLIHDGVRTYLDKKEFCEDKKDTVKYPICERNSWKPCHDVANLTIFVDCEKYR